MNPEIEALKKLAAQKITKAKVQALQKACADAHRLFERLYPKATDKDTTADFEFACDELESALSELECAVDDLEIAEDKDARNDAIFMIEDALEQVTTAFDDIMSVAVLGTEPRPAPAPTAPEMDPEFALQVAAVLRASTGDQQQALTKWVQTAGSPDLIVQRQQKLAQLHAYLRSKKHSAPPPPS
jgi:hypothetical protein